MRHTIFIVPGIFKREGFIERFKNALANDSFEIEVFRVSWLGKDTYQESYETLKKKILEQLQKGNKVSLIGTSAGASFVRKLFNDSDLSISHLVTICGPIRDTNGLIFCIGKMISPTWKTSLSISTSIGKDRDVRYIHTIIPRFDELVPLHVMKVTGAHELHIPGVEHLFSITSATSVYAQNIAKMIQTI